MKISFRQLLQNASNSTVRTASTLVLFIFLTLSTTPGRAYSVLSHEETVDMAWNHQIVPLLLQRYPTATPKDLQIAHSYAYGGCIIQDLGYYPFGNKYFSDLLHYVRTGDFVDNLLKEASNLNEYAFALGALAHYWGDTTGHPAIGVATAREYPGLRRRFGPFVSYYDSPKAHIRTEFGFDVVQVAQGHYVSDDYHNFIGFNVAEPVLERAFKDTYGIDLSMVLKHEDLAVNTYRYSVSTVIPEMTRAAVVDYGKQIQQKVPNFDSKQFVYRLKRTDYEHEWGRQYHRPGIGAHLFAFIIRIMPKSGPFSAFKLKLPNAADQQIYLNSMQTTVNLYEHDLSQIEARPATAAPPVLKDLDYDTGKPSLFGEYPLADTTYARLLNTLTHEKNAEVSSNLRASMLAYYVNLKAPRRKHRYDLFVSRKQKKLQANLRRLRQEKLEVAPAVQQSTPVSSVPMHPSKPSSLSPDNNSIVPMR